MALAITGTGNGSLNNLALSANTGTIVDTGRAGTIIQTAFATSSTETSLNTTTWTATNVSVTITPTSASNYVYVVWNGQINKITSGVGGWGQKIFQDGVEKTTSPNDGTGPFDHYKDETRIWVNTSKVYYGVVGTTSSTTFDFRVRNYNTGYTIDIAHDASSEDGQENLMVMEIQAW